MVDGKVMMWTTVLACRPILLTYSVGGEIVVYCAKGSERLLGTRKCGVLKVVTGRTATGS